jgi:hypothetical protein
MVYETLVAVYDTPAHADAAVKALKAAGFAETDISVFDSARLKEGKSTSAAGVKESGLWHRLFGADVYQHEANIYGETIEDGGVVTSASPKAKSRTRELCSTFIDRSTCTIGR